ncbi:MAG: ABC transporter substrate-binding protein [Thermoplasmatota archaeon]
MDRRMVCLLTALILILSIGIPSITAAQTNESIEITDARGETIKFDSSPEKIVSFMASNTEILFHLDLGDRVVGVDKYSNYPPEVNDLPKVGDAFNVNYEKIVSLDPDVVVISKANTNMISSLNEYDLKVVVTGGNSIDDVYSDTELLGKMCGIEKKAERSADDIKYTMERITQDTGNLKETERPRAFYISGTSEGINTPGNNTFQNALLQNSGCNNIASDKEGWTTISEEEIIGDNPEIIIAPNHLKDSVRDLTSKDSWQSIKAVQENQIFFVNGDIMSRPGPRIVDAQLKMVNINKVVRTEAKRPDLKIKELIISPSNPLTNGTASNISAKVENMGMMDAIKVKISFWYSSQNSKNKTLINTTKINVLESKTTKTTNEFSWNYPKTGNYTITAEIDPSNETHEINEENNDLSSEVIVEEPAENNDKTPGLSTALLVGLIIIIGMMKPKKKRT